MKKWDKSKAIKHENVLEWVEELDHTLTESSSNLESCLDLLNMPREGLLEEVIELVDLVVDNISEVPLRLAPIVEAQIKTLSNLSKERQREEFIKDPSLIGKLNSLKERRFFTRTVEHIHRVQNNMLTLVTKYSEELDLSFTDRRILMSNVMKHDQSKFSLPQANSYIEINDYYRRKKLGLKDEKYDEIYDQAWKDHYREENHHPEKAEGQAFTWDIYNAIECVCDLQAMAQEFNEGSCRKYWEEVWLKKQSKHFSDDYNWVCIQEWMEIAIRCFEKELE